MIFATARGDEGSVVLGLDMGADDYIVKPFRLREVASRIRAVLRRAAGDGEHIARLGDVTIDMQAGPGKPPGPAGASHRAGSTGCCSPFWRTPARPLTRGQLLEGIWDVAGNFVNDNTLSVYIKRLREKLNPRASR